MKLWQLTRPQRPDKQFKTGYGTISYADWLELERKRLVKAGIQCLVRKEDKGGKGVRGSLFRTPWKLKEGACGPEQTIEVQIPKSARVEAVKEGKEKK